MAQRVSENALHLMFARQFWQEIEVLSRNRKERPLHTFAKKAIKQLGIEMIDLAKEEIFNEGDDDDGEITREEAKRLLKEESKLTDDERIERDAIMNAMVDRAIEGSGW